MRKVKFAAFLTALCLGLPTAQAADTVQVVNCSVFGNFTIINDVVKSSSNCAGAAVIPNNVVKVGDEAFLNATNLTSVVIGNNVTLIGDFSFYKGSTQLTNLVIPNSTTTIGNFAFGYATSLKSLTIGENVKFIGDSAFLGASNLTSLIIPESVQSIGKQAFIGLSSITSLTIGKNVMFIGIGAFALSTSLSTIVVDSANLKYSSDLQGVLYNKEKTVLILAPSAKSTIVIPETVVLIDEGSFSDDAKSLVTLIIPATVQVPGLRLITAMKEAVAKAAREQKAKQEAEAAAAKQESGAKATANKKTTITCVKGKLTKKVTAVKPTCPSGYKVKA